MGNAREQLFCLQPVGGILPIYIWADWNKHSDFQIDQVPNDLLYFNVPMIQLESKLGVL